MKRAFLFVATLALAACDRHQSTDQVRKETGSPAAPAPITGEMPVASGSISDPMLVEKARAFAHSDPGAGLKWLFENGLITEGQGSLQAFTGALAQGPPGAMLDLADRIESPQIRVVYLSAAYKALVGRDPGAAWKAWDERHKDHSDEPVVPVFVSEFRKAGLRQAWENLQRHAPVARIGTTEFRAIGSAAELRDDDAVFLIGLLKALPDGSGKTLLEESQVAEALARHDSSGLGGWLDSLPVVSRYDPAYTAMASQCGRVHDFSAARNWLDKIHSDDRREEVLAFVRAQMSSTPVGTKVD